MRNIRTVCITVIIICILADKEDLILKIAYQEKNFRLDSLCLIEQVNTIIAEYQSKGYELTLRQVYYQMVARDIIPNNERSYKNMGNLISDARLAGLVDWDAIIDRTRNLQQNSHWTTPAEIMHACARQFAFDKWEGQDYYVEVWVEKDALIGVVERSCRKLDVPFFSCRGYVSQSEMWSAAQRLIGLAGERQPVIIDDLITKTVGKYCEQSRFNLVKSREKKTKGILENVSANWETIENQYR